jgi:hypothetical protein
MKAKTSIVIYLYVLSISESIGNVSDDEKNIIIRHYANENELKEMLGYYFKYRKEIDTFVAEKAARSIETLLTFEELLKGGGQ